MERQFSSYETLFIVDLALGDEGVKAMIEKFKGMIAEAGTITSVNEWGKRRLAYPINDKNEGYYVLVNFTAPTDFIAELERIYSITEGIMRSMVVAGEFAATAESAPAAVVADAEEAVEEAPAAAEEAAAEEAAAEEAAPAAAEEAEEAAPEDAE